MTTHSKAPTARNYAVIADTPRRKPADTRGLGLELNLELRTWWRLYRDAQRNGDTRFMLDARRTFFVLARIRRAGRNGFSW